MAFADAAASHGLVGGVSIGIHGYSGDNGIFSLAGLEVVATNSERAFDTIVPLNALLPYITSTTPRTYLFW